MAQMVLFHTVTIGLVALQLLLHQRRPLGLMLLVVDGKVQGSRWRCRLGRSDTLDKGRLSAVVGVTRSGLRVGLRVQIQGEGLAVEQ